jgi:hypothetical protein
MSPRVVVVVVVIVVVDVDDVFDVVDVDVVERQSYGKFDGERWWWYGVRRKEMGRGRVRERKSGPYRTNAFMYPGKKESWGKKSEWQAESVMRPYNKLEGMQVTTFFFFLVFCWRMKMKKTEKTEKKEMQ